MAEDCLAGSTGLETIMGWTWFLYSCISLSQSTSASRLNGSETACNHGICMHTFTFYYCMLKTFLPACPTHPPTHASKKLLCLATSEPTSNTDLH